VRLQCRTLPPYLATSLATINECECRRDTPRRVKSRTTALDMAGPSAHPLAGDARARGTARDRGSKRHFRSAIEDRA
jgi:hypothetical protein